MACFFPAKGIFLNRERVVGPFCGLRVRWNPCIFSFSAGQRIWTMYFVNFSIPRLSDPGNRNRESEAATSRSAASLRRTQRHLAGSGIWRDTHIAKGLGAPRVVSWVDVPRTCPRERARDRRRLEPSGFGDSILSRISSFGFRQRHVASNPGATAHSRPHPLPAQTRRAVRLDARPQHRHHLAGHPHRLGFRCSPRGLMGGCPANVRTCRGWMSREPEALSATSGDRYLRRRGVEAV